MEKSRKNTKLTDTLTISECKKGYWLYDKIAGMNLSMDAKTQQDALIDAITYYQKKNKYLETELNRVNKAIDIFTDSICIKY